MKKLNGFGIHFLLIIIINFCLGIFVFLENPSEFNYLDGLLGNIEFSSFFDRTKFFIPIMLLLLTTSDYISYYIGASGSIYITRYSTRGQFLLAILKDLFFFVFKYWIMLISIAFLLNILSHHNVLNLLTIDFVFSVISGYFLYCFIVSLQVLLCILLNSTNSFLIIASIIIICSFIMNSYFRFVFLIPIALGLNDLNTISLIRLTVAISLTLLIIALINNKIGRLDL